MRLYRGFIRDVFFEDGRCAVFVNEQVLVLSEIATVILEATPTDSAATLEEITRAVVEEFGEPEPPLDATDVSRQQVLDMVSHQILRDAGQAHESFTAESVAALTEGLRHLLSDEPGRWQLPKAVSGNQFLAAVRLHRLAPALALGLERMDLPPQVAAQLAADQASEASVVQRQAVELQEIFKALERAGVRALTFKGLALAKQAHGDVTSRGRGDHDLLVAPCDLERAHAVITSLGWAPGMGFARPGGSWAWRHLVRDYYELPLVRGLSSVDLHWHLGPVRSAFPPFDELWSRRSIVAIGDSEVPTFSSYDALAHSATHAAKDNWRWLRSLVDVHRLTSDPRTWQDPDRELRPDQVLTIGLAARLFGTPPGAPAIVAEAAQRAASVMGAAVSRQASVVRVENSRRVPGTSLVSVFGSLGRAGARPADFWRQLSISMLPLTHVAGDPSRHAAVAVPRALTRRLSEVLRLWSSALSRRGV